MKMTREQAQARITKLETDAANFKEKATTKLRSLQSKISEQAAALEAAEAKIREQARQIEALESKLAASLEETRVARGRTSALLRMVGDAAHAAGVIANPKINGPQALGLLADLAEAYADRVEDGAFDLQLHERRLTFLATSAYVSGAGWALSRNVPNRNKSACHLTGELRVKEFVDDLDFAIEMARRTALAREKGVL